MENYHSIFLNISYVRKGYAIEKMDVRKLFQVIVLSYLTETILFLKSIIL